MFGNSRANPVMLSAAILCSATAAPALAQTRAFDIPEQAAERGIAAFGRQGDIQIVAARKYTKGRRTNAVYGEMTVEQGLAKLLHQTGLVARSMGAQTYMVVGAAASEAQAAGLGQSLEAGDPATFAGDATQDEDGEEIVVTGTNIRGIAPTGSPLQVYSREDIRQTGAANMPEFFERLPQNFASVDADSLFFSNAQNNDASTGVDLRGLGSRTTLILVNGRRLAPSGLGTVTDISNIPIAAIERVEILPDGASSTYGSDAVAGVVNFRLLRDFDGAETRLRVQQRHDSDSTQYLASQAIGTSWSGGNLVVAGSYERRERLTAGDRSFDALDDAAFFDSGKKVFSSLAAARQALSPATELNFNLLFSHGTSRNFISDSAIGFTSDQFSNTDQLSAGLGVVHDLGGGWDVTADLAYGLNDIKQRTPLTSGSDHFQSAVVEGRIKADGPVFELPAGTIRAAIGADARREKNRRSSVAQVSGREAFNRSVYSLFGELNVPLIGPGMNVAGVRSLTASGSGRYEHYSDFGSTFNPKVGADWVPVDGISLRSSYSSSFSASRFFDTQMIGNSAIISRINNPACPGRPCLVLAELGSRSSYKPERSKSFTLGVDFEPERLAGFRARATYYKIRYRDRIGAVDPGGSAFLIANASAFPDNVLVQPSAAFITDNVARLTAIGQGVINRVGTYDPAAFDFYLDRRRANLAKSKTSGVDLDVEYRRRALGVEMVWGVNANHILDFVDQLTPVSPEVISFNRVGRPASLRIAGRFGISAPAWRASAYVNHVGNYKNERRGIVEPVRSWTTVDLNASFDLGRGLTPKLDGVELGLVAQNLFNTRPPEAHDLFFDFGFDPTNANPYGRVLGVELVKRW